jgi:FixJ family two-component response regulator
VKGIHILFWVSPALRRAGSESLVRRLVLPFELPPSPEVSAGELAVRLADPGEGASCEVLLVEDAFPFEDSLDLLTRTDDLPSRPVIIVAAPGIDVAGAVGLMERGAFTVLPGVPESRTVAESVERAVENRRNLQALLAMSADLREKRRIVRRQKEELTTRGVKLRRKVTEVALMRGVAEMLGKSRTLEEGLREIVPRLARFAGASHGVFHVVPERGD